MFKNACLPPDMFIFHVTPYMFISHVLSSYMDLYSVDMMLDAYALIHISLLHARIVAHMQDPSSKLHSHMVRTCRLF